MDTNPAFEFQPAAVMELDTMEALDALVSSFRLRLVACFRRPSTVKEVARQLGVNVTRIYHHLHRLVDHGFLVEVGERPAGKTVEKVYTVAALNVRPSAAFLDRYGTEGNAELMRLSFQTVGSEVVAAARLDPSLDPSGETSTLGFTRLHISEADLRELVSEVDSLFDEYKSRTGDIEVSFFSSVIPLRELKPDG